MRIACVLTAAELRDCSADLVVFPEGVSAAAFEVMAHAQREPVVVGAVRDGIHSRAVVWHKGKNHVSYLKLETDGLTQGTGNAEQDSLVHFPEISVAVLVCMDVQNVAFATKVRDALRASPGATKVLCIPADMGGYWFQGETLAFPALYADMYVALCNGTGTHNVRCKSFIADPTGRKVRVQSNVEPIHFDVP